MARPKYDERWSSMTQLDNVGEGWRPIIERLEADLLEIDPDYTVDQIKEKFGGLRYYATSTGDFDFEGPFEQRIRQAEAEADKTCEFCGTTEGVTTEGSWLKTLCPACREQRETARAAIWKEAE